MCKQNCKQFFVMIKHEKVNKKGVEQGYETKLYLNLMLNKLKVLEVLFLFILFEDSIQGTFHGGFHVPINLGSFLIFF